MAVPAREAQRFRNRGCRLWCLFVTHLLLLVPECPAPDAATRLMLRAGQVLTDFLDPATLWEGAAVDGAAQLQGQLTLQPAPRPAVRLQRHIQGPVIPKAELRDGQGHGHIFPWETQNGDLSVSHTNPPAGKDHQVALRSRNIAVIRRTVRHSLLTGAGDGAGGGAAVAQARGLGHRNKSQAALSLRPPSKTQGL
ncbi:hypothetical protein AAY473_027910 [Plecturocebus cupreus]